MKTAAEPSQKTQTIITRQVISAPNGSEAPARPEFWAYIENLKPEEWEEHSIYLYRTEPRASTYGEGNQALEKIMGQIEMSPGNFVPFNNREDVELAIRQKHGGKAFRLILKRRSERITEGKIVNDAPPRFLDRPDTFHSSPTVTQMSEANSTADVAKTAMSTMANQDRQATEVAISALRGAADVVAKMAQQNTPPPKQETETDVVMRQVLIAMLQRSMNPPDPIDTFTKLLAVMHSNAPAPTASGAAPASPFVDRLMDAAVERFLNPRDTTPATSASAELVRQLPSVAGYITQAMAEWRHGVEAQRDAAAIMRGGVPVPGAPPTVTPARLPAPATIITTPPTASAQQIDLAFLETKIVEILRKTDLSAEEAADDCLSFLDLIDPAIVKHLVSLGEPGLMNLFQTRPILQQVTTQNLPRVIEFIKAFMKFATPNPAPPAANGQGGPVQ